MTATVKLQLKFQCKFDWRDPGQVSWVEQMIGALDPDLDPKLYSLQRGSFSADLPDEEDTMPDGWEPPPAEKDTKHTDPEPVANDAEEDHEHVQVPGTEFKVTGTITAAWDPDNELELAWIRTRVPSPYGVYELDDTAHLTGAQLWDEMNGRAEFTIKAIEVMWRKVA